MCGKGVEFLSFNLIKCPAVGQFIKTEIQNSIFCIVFPFKCIVLHEHEVVLVWHIFSKLNKILNALFPNSPDCISIVEHI